VEQEAIGLKPLPDEPAHKAEEITAMDFHRPRNTKQNHESDRPLRPVLAPQFEMSTSTSAGGQKVRVGGQIARLAYRRPRYVAALAASRNLVLRQCG
jgi:hypothetical protein